MQKKKIKLRHYVEYVFFTAFILMVKLSPLFLAGLNKKILYFLVRKITRKRFNVVEKNLKIAFPEDSEDQRSIMRERIYRHFASVFVEIIYLFVKKNGEKILKKIEVNNIEILKEALEKKRGVILFSAHFGNWELIPMVLSRELNCQIASIAREMNNPLVEKVVRRFREKMGSHIIYKQNSIRQILKTLDDNRIVYLLIDQNTIEREAVFVDFFGKKVSAVPSVSQLYLRKDKPVVPIFLHYEEDRIVLQFEPEIDFKGGTEREDIR
ncbi:MAG: lysophospholipid acyltransferase family protein, partial [bacterium]|nr:lysophospholipid acyltransferase family protein [bacterium]